jgi:hypothetical protein
MHYVCALIDDTLKVWTPKDANEVKCIIENMRESRNYCKVCILLKNKKISLGATTTRDDWNSRVQEHLSEQIHAVRFAVSSTDRSEFSAYRAGPGERQSGYLQWHLCDDQVHVQEQNRD